MFVLNVIVIFVVFVKKIHDNKFYSHILDFPHKYGEEIDIRKRHRRYASVG